MLMQIYSRAVWQKIWLLFSVMILNVWAHTFRLKTVHLRIMKSVKVINTICMMCSQYKLSFVNALCLFPTKQLVRVTHLFQRSWTVEKTDDEPSAEILCDPRLVGRLGIWSRYIQLDSQHVDKERWTSYGQQVTVTWHMICTPFIQCHMNSTHSLSYMNYGTHNKIRISSIRRLTTYSNCHAFGKTSALAAIFM